MALGKNTGDSIEIHHPLRTVHFYCFSFFGIEAKKVRNDVFYKAIQDLGRLYWQRGGMHGNMCAAEKREATEDV